MNNFFYSKPMFSFNKEGNMEIIKKRSVNPIEIIIYGITEKKEFYFDWTFPYFYPDDSELEHEHKIISKKEMLEALSAEIELCDDENNQDMLNAYKKAKEFIEKGGYLRKNKRIALKHWPAEQTKVLSKKDLVTVRGARRVAHAKSLPKSQRVFLRKK